MRTGTGTNQIWAREEGKHVTWGNTGLTVTPPSPNGASRTEQHPNGEGGGGGGRSGGLKGHGDRTET